MYQMRILSKIFFAAAAEAVRLSTDGEHSEAGCC